MGFCNGIFDKCMSIFKYLLQFKTYLMWSPRQFFKAGKSEPQVSVVKFVFTGQDLDLPVHK